MYLNEEQFKTPVATPSMSSFVAWLETKDPDKTYDYNDCQGACLVGMYLNDIGLEWWEGGGLNYFLSPASHDLTIVSAAEPYTFGAALKRAMAW